MIVLRDVIKQYKNKFALYNVSLHINLGRVCIFGWFIWCR